LEPHNGLFVSAGAQCSGRADAKKCKQAW
jgi:hypothetical protein